ncbi:MAG TPA: GtrA family protein [Smithella sp.]|nr:GtrA family protein [Smithella sp.]
MKISWKQLWQEHQIKIRFFFIGVWNTIFGYLAYIGLDYLFTFVFQKRYLAYMTAAVVANIIATISAFIFHKYITFKSTVRGRAVIIEFFKFYSMYTVTNILGLGLLPFFVEVMKIDPKISGALLIPITAIISYFGHSRFSFVKR